jgi:peptidoglycan/LPS O-acetylase OafA/YrhL
MPEKTQHDEHRLIGNRLVPLEAYRGIAAFIVLIHHFFLGFSPYTTGFMDRTRNGDSLIGEPFFAIFNGTGAVSFFFTLSGFVLCWSYFNHESQQKLLIAFLKRFPRLAAIVTVSTIISYLLFKFGFYYFREAAQLNSSPWLATFGGSGWSPEFEINFLKALYEALTTFFNGQANYNSNLWTMKPEFFGSIIVYMLASFISVILGYRYLAYAFAIIAISALNYNPLIFPFVAGTFLSAYLAKNKIEISLLSSLGLIAVGLYMLGYIIPEKAYQWTSFVPAHYKVNFQTLINSLGSIFIIFATMSNRKLFQYLNGKFFKYLGKISFPLYLIHPLVIFSISSYAYLYCSAVGMGTQVKIFEVFVITAVVSIALSIPLSMFDDWWVKQVNAISRKMLHVDK